MRCEKCGNEMEDYSSDFCTRCGNPMYPASMDNGYGVYSSDPFRGERGACIGGFVCSLVGLNFFGLIGIIMGFIAKGLCNKALDAGCTVKLARAGKIISIIDICLGFVGVALIIFYACARC